MTFASDSGFRISASDGSELTCSQFLALAKAESVKLKLRFAKTSPYIILPAENSAVSLIRIYATWLAGYTPVLISPDATANEKKDYKSQLAKETKIYSKLLLKKKEIAGIKSGLKLKPFTPLPRKEAVIIFTSGSTGKPKGIIHTFASLTASAALQNKLTKSGENSEWLMSLPLYHIGGFMIFFRAMLSGSGLYIAEKSGAGYLKELLPQKEITHLSLVPAQCSELLRTPEVFKRVKCLLLGGGPVEKKIIIELRKRKIPTQIIYGSSETAAFCSAVKPEEVKNPKRLGTKPLRGMRFMAIDEYRKPLLSDQEGKIVISSQGLFKGYTTGDQESFFEYRRRRFYITSDMGYIDSDGFIHITRRADSIIITGGKKVSVSEVEKTLVEIAGVTEAKVFGTKDDYWGEIVCAAVAANGISSEFLISALKKKLSGFKIPKNWLILRELPKTELGKTDTAALIRMMS